MAGTDDLAPLLLRGPDTGLRFHQGLVLAWDDQTGANTIRVKGVDLVNVPVLNLTEVLVLRAGLVVGLLSAGHQWWILGRLTLPGTNEFFSGAMPSIGTPFYPVNVPAEMRTNTIGGFFSKLQSGHIINHRTVRFGGKAQVSTGGAGTCTGAWRVQWYTTPPPNTADPPGGTLMGTVTGLVGGTGTGYLADLEYTWPAGMRQQTVYVSWEAELTTSSVASGTTHYAAVVPTYFTGDD